MDTSDRKMEARPATSHDPPAAPGWRRPTPPEPEDPFRLGYRVSRIATPGGREVVEQIPLTAEDLVYPQEGDHVSRGLAHFSFLHPQADALRRFLEKRRSGVLVTSDVLLVLRHDGKTCSPDVAVIEGEVDTSGIRGGIHLAEAGGRLIFAFEAVSAAEKEMEEKDLEKNLERYAREGVEEYFTVYPEVGRQVRDLVGRRLAEGGYVEIPADARGRVASQTLGLFFKIDPESEELVAVDAETGQRLLTSDEEEARADREAEARRQAEDRAEQVLRRTIEDLCALLGIEWTAGRSTAVAGMDSAQLEALRADLLNRKRWP